MKAQDWLGIFEAYFANALADVSKNVIGSDIWRIDSGKSLCFHGEFDFADFSGNTIRTHNYRITAKFVEYVHQYIHGINETRFFCELQDRYGRKVLHDIDIDGPDAYNKLIGKLTIQMNELYNNWHEFDNIKRKPYYV